VHGSVNLMEDRESLREALVRRVQPAVRQHHLK
jgi:hypothetical protein